MVKDKKKDEPKNTESVKNAEEKMSNEETTAKEEDEAKGFRKFTPKKILLFIVLPLVLILSLGIGVYFSGILDSVLPEKTLVCENVKKGDKNFDKCTAQAAAENTEFLGSFLTMDDIIVNLNSSGKQPRFLKIAVKLEMENAAEQKKIEPLMPRLMDQFQMYLRELRVKDLRGTSGIYRMKIELLNRVRAAAPDVKVRDVLFQEILVQ